MDQEDNFYTLKGYSLLEHIQITSSMEDYLEMICRLSQDGTPVRIGDLAKCLHVRPSSASKMAGNLRSHGLVRFEKYGTVTLTGSGASAWALSPVPPYGAAGFLLLYQSNHQ